MTSYVVTTSQTTTEDLSATDDDLLVTSSGSIVITVGLDAVDSTAASQAITIDGLVYSADGSAGVGVDITGDSTSLYVNGQVQGDTGVTVDDTNSAAVNVGTQGTVDGLDGSAIQFAGNVSSPTVTDYSLSNAGDISDRQANAVLFQGGGGDLITNTGQISGPVAVAVYDNVATETVENSGTITGGTGINSSAIISANSSAGIDIDNSGLITDGAANTIGPSAALIYFNDHSGTTSTIDNTGTISGSGYVIQSVSDILDISNSGTIHGGLYSTSAVDIDNSGLWQGQAGAVYAWDLVAGGDAITNTGTIEANIEMISGQDQIRNTGTITSIYLTGSDTGNNLTNSGAGQIDNGVIWVGGFASTGSSRSTPWWPRKARP